MDAHQRGVAATEQVQAAGIDCTIDSARPDSVTVLCGAGVMAYHNGKLLMLGEHVPLTDKPEPFFINDAVNHRHIRVLV